MNRNEKDDVIGIVVLNYKNFHETINCVNSLLSQKGVLFEIVIVDNGSNNESYKEIVQQFESNKKIQVIKNEDNLGYSRGNNIGIKCLQSKGINNIFVANSDLIFSNPYTLKQVLEAYEPGVGLINPIICNPNGQLDHRVTYKKKYLYARFMKKFFEWYFGKDFSFEEHFGKEKDVITSEKKTNNSQKDRYIVAGSGFLLTKDFFSMYEGLYPGTFLYYEEWATIILLHKAGLKTKVANTEPITHIGGASTPDNIRKMSKERRKICLESWKSIFLLAIGFRYSCK